MVYRSDAVEMTSEDLASTRAGSTEPRLSLLSQLLAMRRCVPCVVDTNVLAFDVIYSYRHQRTTALVAASRSGSGPVFAATHVFDETPRLLANQARRQGIPAHELHATWDRLYADAVRFVDVPPIDPDPRLDMVRRDDADDALSTNELGLGLRIVVGGMSYGSSISRSGLASLAAGQSFTAYALRWHRDHRLCSGMDSKARTREGSMSVAPPAAWSRCQAISSSSASSSGRASGSARA